MQPRFSLFALVVLAACGDDGGGTPVDSGTHDAAADTAPDADPSIAPLVGTWLKGADSWSGQMIPMVTFRANGTVSLGEEAAASEGTYTVPTPGRLKMVFGTDAQELDFVIGNDHLLLSAMVPQGTVTGLVGTWKTTFTTNGTMGSSTMMIAANNTGAYTLSGPTGSQVWNGTWATEGTGLVFTATTPTALTSHLRPIGMAGIGTQLFTKQ